MPRTTDPRSPLATALLLGIALATSGCRSLGIDPGWSAYETRIDAHAIHYALPKGGVALQPPQASWPLAIPKRDKVSIFASIGYGEPAGEQAPVRLSLGLGRVPGGPLTATPSVEQLGALVLAEAQRVHKQIRYTSELQAVGDTTWFRLENDVPGSEGVQPEAVVYYQPLNASHYVFVWGFWAPEVRRSAADLETHRRELEHVVARTRIEP
jgi:hypothetical protein